MTIATCQCGKVEAQAEGSPIIALSCHCKDCRDGAAKVEALCGAPANPRDDSDAAKLRNNLGASKLRDDSGGVPFVLYRKDRFRFTRGQELLKTLQVESDSPGRVYASCCNSGFVMGLPEFLHWVPVHRARFREAPPATQGHINMKSHLAEGAKPPTDAPVYPGLAPKMIFGLLKAKAQMVLARR